MRCGCVLFQLLKMYNDYCDEESRKSLLKNLTLSTMLDRENTSSVSVRFDNAVVITSWAGGGRCGWGRFL